MASQPRQRPAKAKGRRKQAATFFFSKRQNHHLQNTEGQNGHVGNKYMYLDVKRD